MRSSGRVMAIATIAILFAVVVLLTLFGSCVYPHGSGREFAVAISLDGIAILLVLSYASWHGIWWTSFLRPRSYGRGVALSVGSALVTGLTALVAFFGAFLSALADRPVDFFLATTGGLVLSVAAGVLGARALILACLWWLSP